MDKSTKLRLIIEIVSVIAIVATLIFLSIEIRQNTLQMALNKSEKW